MNVPRESCVKKCLNFVLLCGLGLQSSPVEAQEFPTPHEDLMQNDTEDGSNRVTTYPMMMGMERQPDNVWFLPVINYNSDIGVGYGGLLTYKFPERDGKPIQALRFVAFYSALKAARMGVNWERAPGPNGLHTMLLAFYDQTYYSNYFGVGNAVDPKLELDLPQDDYDTISDYYTQFTLRVPHAHLLLQYPLRDSETVKLFAAVRERYLTTEYFDRERVEAETGIILPDTYQSLLEEDQPYGSEGGLVSTVQLGVLVDSRDFVVAPSTGGFNEVSVRGGMYQSKPFGGVNLTFRRYIDLPYSFVIASRAVADFQFGAVPFLELAAFGASEHYSGLGGTLAGRGLKLRHFIGRGKVLWGPELRFTPHTFHLNHNRVDLSGAVFLESGRVWNNYQNQGEGLGLHSQVGTGLRIIWAKRVLVRFDVAKSLRDDDPLGVYLVFGHPY